MINFKLKSQATFVFVLLAMSMMSLETIIAAMETGG